MLSKLWFRALLIICLGLIEYSFMLGAPFRVLDDENSILNNPAIHDTAHIKDIFAQGVFKDQTYYRPLVNLSFMGEYHFFGLKPFYYYLDNLFLHILNAFLVWGLVSLILENVTLGFFASLLFLIHPINAEAVNNISGRAILLGAFFSLISLSSFLLYEKLLKKRFLLLCVMSFGLALLCKESSSVLPGVILLYLWFRQKSATKMWSLAVMVGLYVLLRMSLGITHLFLWENTSQQVLGFITFLCSLITGFRELLLPVGLYFDRSQRLFLSFNDFQAVMTVIFWLVFLLGLWINRRRISKITWFLLGWFALEMLPVSQIIHVIGVSPGMISAADHFLYLACIPIFIILIQEIKTMVQMNVEKKWIKAEIINFVVGAFLVFLFLTNIEQNIYASNERAMLQRSAEYQPLNGRVQSSLGLVYARKEQFVQAQEHFTMAVLASPHNPRYRISLAKSICDQGLYQECLKIYNEIDKPGEFAKLLEENKKAAQDLMDQQHAQVLPK